MKKYDVKEDSTLYYPEFTMSKRLYMVFQRVVSFIFSLFGIIVLSPLFLLLALWVAADSKGPVFFVQKRVARSKPDGTYRFFSIYKFRTMYVDAPKDMPTHLLQNSDACITKAGRFLRKTSLDELPQLFNVLKGDMNLIGPRPALYNQTELLALRDRYGANFVRPGITGLAQVMGRDELPEDVKARYDGIYAQNVGFSIDIYSFFKTISVVLKSDGVVEGGTGAIAQESEKKKKILICTNHSYMLYQFRRELISKLLENYEVVLSMPFVGHEEDFELMGCKCVETKLDRRGINPFTDLKLLRFYKKLLKKEKPDKVITYSIKPNIYVGMLCSSMKIPYCANVQGLGTAFQKRMLAQLVGFMYRIAFRKVDVVFFENKANAQEFLSRNLMDKDKACILNGAGVNLERYEYTPHQKDCAKSETKRHFLFIGRIMREKGIDELFDAVRRLKAKYGDGVVLDIVGFFEDEYAEAVKEMENNGTAVFHGFQSDSRPYYAMSDVVVLPSYHEGMSNVLLEASAMGRPVITSDIPGCREAVEDGKTGYLCAPKDVDALYDKMELMMDKTVEDLDEMGQYARERMENLFDKNVVVRQTLEAMGLYNNEISGETICFQTTIS